MLGFKNRLVSNLASLHIQIANVITRPFISLYKDSRPQTACENTFKFTHASCHRLPIQAPYSCVYQYPQRYATSKNFLRQWGIRVPVLPSDREYSKESLHWHTTINSRYSLGSTCRRESNIICSGFSPASFR